MAAVPIVCLRVQSTALPLLIRTPNGRHAAGMGRDRYVPNPGAVLPAQVEMFVFLGKLMGHALRLASRAVWVSRCEAMKRATFVHQQFSCSASPTI